MRVDAEVHLRAVRAQIVHTEVLMIEAVIVEEAVVGEVVAIILAVAAVEDTTAVVMAKTKAQQVMSLLHPIPMGNGAVLKTITQITVNLTRTEPPMEHIRTMMRQALMIRAMEVMKVRKRLLIYFETSSSSARFHVRVFEECFPDSVHLAWLSPLMHDVRRFVLSKDLSIPRISTLKMCAGA